MLLQQFDGSPSKRVVERRTDERHLMRAPDTDSLTCTCLEQGRNCATLTVRRVGELYCRAHAMEELQTARLEESKARLVDRL